MEEYYFKKAGALLVLAILLVLTFLILKPIILAITMAAIFAIVFAPSYDRIYARTHSRNLSATIVCLGLILIIILPIWLLTPIFIQQSIDAFQFSQQVDFVTPLQSVFPSLFASHEFSQEVGSIMSSFVSNVANTIVNGFAGFILNFPRFFFQLVVVFFTLFFILRDKEKVLDYVKSLSPFSKEVENKLFNSSKNLTLAVIYGQVVVGMIQGMIAGIGFFIFGVNNALFLTFLAVLAGMFPVIGTGIVWIPVAIYMLIGGSTFPAVGVAVFGIISASVDNILRPLFVSKRTRIHPAILLIGMIGGLFFFGILGFILGPLILAYVLIILETYREEKL